MKNVDLGRNTTLSEEALILKCLADYNFELSNVLYVGIRSTRLQKIINEEFARTYEVMNEITENRIKEQNDY